MSETKITFKERAQNVGAILWKHKAYFIGIVIGIIATHQFYQAQIMNHIFEIKEEIRNNNGVNSQAEAILKNAADLINNQSGQWEGVKEDLEKMNRDYERSKIDNSDSAYSRPSDMELINQLNERLERLDSRKE